MPKSSPQTLLDRLQQTRSSTHPTLDGGEELLKDNLAENQHFIDIDEFGDAEGYPFEVPSPTTGFHFYASAVGKNSLRKQTGVPNPSSSAGWDMTEPFLSEGTLPVSSSKIAAFGDYRPPAPLVISVAGGKAGYAAGTRELYVTLVSRSGRHTLPSEGVSFTLTSGQGFTATAPDGLPNVRIGWWLTSANGGRNTARLQKITRGKSATFAGPYKSGRLLPTANETELAQPPRMRFGKRGMIYRAPAPGFLYPGDYRFSWARRTAFGYTRASGWSDVITIQGVQGTDEEGNPVTLPVPNTAFYIRKPRKTRDMVGWVLYVQINGVSYRVQGTGALGDQTSYLGFGDLPVRIYGDTDTENPQRTNLVLIQEPPPNENTSGLESPTGSPDNISPFQASTSLAATGKRNYAYAEVVEDGRGGEKVSLPSPSVSHTTAAGEYARVIPPDPANIFPNAEGRERGSDGVPLGAVVSGANGSYLHQNSKHVITTNGNAYASDTVRFEFGLKEVNTSLTYCFKGVLEAEIVAGTAQVLLLEYDGAGTLIGAGRALKDVSSTGSSPFEVRVGPNGDWAWSAGAVSATVRLQMTGSTRNMVARAYHLAGHPYPMSPRKLEEGGAYETANFDPPIEYPFPRGVVAAVGPPPAASGSVESTPPLAELDFTASSTLSEPGWTHVAPGITSQIETISGERVWRIHDLTKDQIRTGYLAQNFTPSDSLAIRQQEKVIRLPGGTGNHTEKIRIQGGNAYYLGSVRFFSQNGVRLDARDTNGNKFDSGPIASVFDGDEVDYEIIASGVGTNDGTLTLLFGRNGEQRRIVGSITGIDWRTRQASEVRVGTPREDNPNTLWQYYIKKVTVTQSGDAIGEAATPPSGEATTPPDRPTRSYATWQASTSYVVGDERVPTTSNGRYYRVTVAGTSGSSEPAWPTTSGATVTDGGVTWQEAGGIYIDEDEDGNTINQLYLFVPPNYASERFDINNVTRWPVIPGTTYSFAIRGRHTVPAGSEGTMPWFLVLFNPETGEEKEIGYPYTEVSGTAGWAERTIPPFTVDEGFTELRAHFKNVGPGLYVFQDIALSQGNAVVRGYGCALSGWFRTRLKGKTPYISPVAPRLDLGWRDIGVVAESPEGTSITPSYEYSDDLSTWTAFTPPDLPDAVYGAVRVDMSGDGRETPYVAAGSPYLSWNRPLPTLCRESGASFMGGTIIDGITPPTSRPEYDSDRVGGRNIHTDLTEAVNRFRDGFRVGFFNEADARLFIERCVEERWIAEVPLHGGSVAGKSYTLDIDEPVEPVEEVGRGLIFDDTRNVWGWVEVSGAEVIEEGDLA